MRLLWSSQQTIFGLLVAAQRPAGICAVVFSDSLTAGLRDIQTRMARRFRIAPETIQCEQSVTASHLQAWGIWIQAYQNAVIPLAPTGQSPPLPPLDPGGTVFQQTVWYALQTLPLGTTQSYSALANAIGKPLAVRAVASACAANPCALIVPCHRVVGAQGQITGYRWGSSRKQQVLQWERERMSLTG